MQWTHSSPQEPDAILSPILSNRLSISQSLSLGWVAAKTAEWGKEPDKDPYIFQHKMMSIPWKASGKKVSLC